MKKTIFLLLYILSTFWAKGQWEQTKIPEGFAVQSLSSIDNSLFIVIGGTILETEDEGERYLFLMNNAPSYSYTSFFKNTNGMFAGSRTNGLIRSTNSGANWEELENDFSNREVSYVFGDNEQLFAIISNSVYKSTNNGDSWKRTTFVSNLGLGPIFKGAIIDSTVILTANDGIYRSVDQGETWEAIGFENSFSFRNITVLANGDIYVADTGSGVYKSTDNGLNWVNIRDGLQNNVIEGLTHLENGTVIAASNENIYQLDEVTNIWVPIFEEEIPFHPSTIIAHQDDLYIGSYGMGVWKGKVGFITSSTESINISDKLKLYPNPVTTAINLSALNGQFPAKIVIVDPLGRIAKDIYQDIQANPLVFVGDLPNGYYYLSIKQGDEIQTTSFIKQ